MLKNSRSYRISLSKHQTNWITPGATSYAQTIRKPNEHSWLVFAETRKNRDLQWLRAITSIIWSSVCDINVQGHDPIKQRSRWLSLHHLWKLYELLKGLSKSRLISFTRFPWASPQAIVPNKNGVTIRLCIDYKISNAVTASLNYLMPIAEDLLTEHKSYQWLL